MDAVVYRVTSSVLWPERVAPLAQALSQPFPSWLQTGPYPAHSAFAKRSSSLLQEKLQCHLSSAPSENVQSADSELDQLDAMFDFILSISTLVREIGSSPSQVDCVRQSCALWVLFTTTIWRSISNELSVQQEASYIKPLQSGDRPVSESDFDGNATLVVSHVVMPVATPKTRDSEESDAEIQLDEVEDGGSFLSSSDPSSPSPPIDVPFEAHILAGTGVRFFAELPVFVIADSDNITTLLGGVVYQRHVWGIDEPAVGLVLSKSGRMGQVVFAWTETSSTVSTDLPLVYFASGDEGCQTGSPLGIFDLSAPLDAFAFAQFVLQLHDHYRVIAEASIAAVGTCTSFSWRSDLAVGDPLFEDHWHDRIERWIQGIDHDCDSSIGPSESSPPSVPNVPPPTQTGESGNANSKRSTLIASDSKISSLPSRVFSDKGDNDLDTRNSISNWLTEHNVVVLSSVEVGHINLTKLNQMIALYDQLTAEGWIEEWHELDDLPKKLPTNRLMTLREQLYASWVKSTGMKPLRKDLANAMISRLSFVLTAADGARVHDETSEYYGANEADRRHIWDALLLWFAGADSLQGDRQRYDVHFERMLNAPRNPSADLPTQSDILNEFAGWLLRNRLFASQIDAASCRLFYARLDVIAGINPLPDGCQHLIGQSQAARIQADHMLHNFRTRIQENEDFIQTVKQHLGEQPWQGKCDALLVAAVPALFEDESLRPGPTLDTTFNRLSAQLCLVQPPTAGSNEATWGSEVYTNSKPVPEPSQSAIEKWEEAPFPSQTSQLAKMSKASSVKIPKRAIRHLDIDNKQLLRDYFICYRPPKDTVATVNEVPVSTQTSSEDSPPVRSNDLLLPILVAEYKKKDEDMYNAVDRCRFSLVSSLCFLHALGLSDEPVFGLVVDGHRGILTMGWRDDEGMCVMERNCCSYDITEPMSVFQFAVTLLRLARRRGTLKTRFEAQRERLRNVIKSEKGKEYEAMWWSKEAQIPKPKENAQVPESL